ncbi:hypothetical protein K437DRAFT_274017 [Tilletiaria anomala UBC 951]|uniref:Uncharacterized protein n=1 Tax=Tilletiaria anomala (strain ATCC 24038 / CBS 436.72 / UBC 951) TaxID=1037660 RepID=A0A066VXA3_TILAU|nr:uncharacterized protein K437DRAFT_274017 [Tilletiaria anomala UBC 951]KDN46131.1 hypothetical protein K437DRAFT_274017 [Tilletiaria anomala UBC 951]
MRTIRFVTCPATSSSSCSPRPDSSADHRVPHTYPPRSLDISDAHVNVGTPTHTALPSSSLNLHRSDADVAVQANQQRGAIYLTFGALQATASSMAAAAVATMEPPFAPQDPVQLLSANAAGAGTGRTRKSSEQQENRASSQAASGAQYAAADGSSGSSPARPPHSPASHPLPASPHTAGAPSSPRRDRLSRTHRPAMASSTLLAFAHQSASEQTQSQVRMLGQSPTLSTSPLPGASRYHPHHHGAGADSFGTWDAGSESAAAVGHRSHTELWSALSPPGSPAASFVSAVTPTRRRDSLGSRPHSDSRASAHLAIPLYAPLPPFSAPESGSVSRPSASAHDCDHEARSPGAPQSHDNAADSGAEKHHELDAAMERRRTGGWSKHARRWSNSFGRSSSQYLQSASPYLRAGLNELYDIFNMEADTCASPSLLPTANYPQGHASPTRSQSGTGAASPSKGGGGVLPRRRDSQSSEHSILFGSPPQSQTQFSYAHGSQNGHFHYAWAMREEGSHTTTCSSSASGCADHGRASIDTNATSVASSSACTSLRADGDDEQVLMSLDMVQGCSASQHTNSYIPLNDASDPPAACMDVDVDKGMDSPRGGRGRALGRSQSARVSASSSLVGEQAGFGTAEEKRRHMLSHISRALRGNAGLTRRDNGRAAGDAKRPSSLQGRQPQSRASADADHGAGVDSASLHKRDSAHRQRKFSNLSPLGAPLALQWACDSGRVAERNVVVHELHKGLGQAVIQLPTRRKVAAYLGSSAAIVAGICVLEVILHPDAFSVSLIYFFGAQVGLLLLGLVALAQHWRSPMALCSRAIRAHALAQVLVSFSAFSNLSSTASYRPHHHAIRAAQQLHPRSFSGVAVTATDAESGPARLSSASLHAHDTDVGSISNRIMYLFGFVAQALLPLALAIGLQFYSGRLLGSLSNKVVKKGEGAIRAQIHGDCAGQGDNAHARDASSASFRLAMALRAESQVGQDQMLGLSPALRCSSPSILSAPAPLSTSPESSPSFVAERAAQILGLRHIGAVEPLPLPPRSPLPRAKRAHKKSASTSHINLEELLVPSWSAATVAATSSSPFSLPGATPASPPSSSSLPAHHPSASTPRSASTLPINERKKMA